MYFLVHLVKIHTILGHSHTQIRLNDTLIGIRYLYKGSGEFREEQWKRKERSRADISAEWQRNCQQQGFSPWTPLAFLARKFIAGTCSVHYNIFSSDPGFCPLDASSTLPFMNIKRCVLNWGKSSDIKFLPCWLPLAEWRME